VAEQVKQHGVGERLLAAVSDGVKKTEQTLENGYQQTSGIA